MSTVDPTAPALDAPAPHTNLSGRRRLVAAGNFFFRWRNHIFPLTFALLWVLSRPRPAFGSFRADAIVDIAGFAIALCGQILRAGAIGYAYIIRGGKKRRIHADALVQEGLFAHSRNPLYAGNFLVFLGLFVMIHSAFGYAVGVPFFAFAYIAIVAAEEDFLLRRFGDVYADYCRRVSRFLPALGGMRRTLGSMHFDLGRLVRKEYGSTFTWLTLALAIEAREQIAWHGVHAARPVLAWLFGAFVVLVTAYATARFLKKTRRL